MDTAGFEVNEAWLDAEDVGSLRDRSISWVTRSFSSSPGSATDLIWAAACIFFDW
jgi:hypothetical protein